MFLISTTTLRCRAVHTANIHIQNQAPPSLLAYSSSIRSSYNLSAAFSASDLACCVEGLAGEVSVCEAEDAAWLMADLLFTAVSELEGLSEELGMGSGILEVVLCRGITCLRGLTENRISFGFGLREGFAYLL